MMMMTIDDLRCSEG